MYSCEIGLIEHFCIFDSFILDPLQNHTKQKINAIIANFLWYGAKGEKKNCLAYLDVITRMKKYGNWGLKEIKIFRWDFINKEFLEGHKWLWYMASDNKRKIHEKIVYYGLV